MKFMEHAARHYADLRAVLERDGTPMGKLDLMIATHPLAIDATLFTRDRAFRRVKQLRTEKGHRLRFRARLP